MTVHALGEAPQAGEVFTNPRGRQYRVLGPSSKEGHVEVVDVATGTKDRAFWPLMVPENGWHRVTSLRVGEESER